MRGPMSAVATALLGLAALGFVSLAAAPWLGGEAASLMPAAAAPEAPQRLEADLAERAAPDLSPFLARPLFSAARRPPPPEAPGVPIEDPNAGLLFGRWEIAGVVSAGSGAVALLRDRDGRLVRLRVGDRIATAEGDEAEATSVTLDALTFRRRGATVAAPVRREGTKTE